MVRCPPGPRPSTRPRGERARRGPGGRRPPPRGARRPRRARQPLVPLEPQPRSPRGGARRARRGALAAPRPAADRRRRPPGPARTPASPRCCPASPRPGPRSPTTPSPPCTPVLGVVEVDDRTFVLADIPGIIEGAHEGAGLGLQFLRHVERTRALAPRGGRLRREGRDPVADLHAVREEVSAYSPAPPRKAPDRRGHQARRGRGRRSPRRRCARRPAPGPRGRARSPRSPARVSSSSKRRSCGARRAAVPNGPRPGEPGMRIGLMGGTFDPDPPRPPARRRERARGALRSTSSLFVPAAVPPHRTAPLYRRRRSPRHGRARHRRQPGLRRERPRAAPAGAELHGRHRGRAASRSGRATTLRPDRGQRHLGRRWRAGASPSGCSRSSEVAVVDRPGDEGPASPPPSRARGVVRVEGPGPAISATEDPRARARGAEHALPRPRCGGGLHRRAEALLMKMPASRGDARPAPPSPRRPRTWWPSTCGASSFTDYFLLASGQNQRQLVAIADAILDVLRDEGLRPAHVEGYPRQEWILLDYAGFVVHIFTPRIRGLLRPRAAVGRGRAAGDRGRDAARRRARLAGVVAALARPCGRSLALVRRGSPRRRSPVLLEGESGTGKDLVAHLLHYQGPRRDDPFIKVHCPSMPEELLESELFGHEKGAFTDARQAEGGQDRDGAPAAPSTSTRSRTCSLPLQAKLLRVVEERRFERLGGTRTIEVDVRFVASPNVDLAEAVRRGPLPRGPLPPAERGAAEARRRCATAARTSCPWPSSSSSASASGGRPRPPASSRRPPRGSARLPLAGQRARAALGGGARRARAAAGDDRAGGAARAGARAAGDAVGRARAPALAARTSSRPTSATCSTRWAAARPGRRRSWASAARRCGRSGAATASR